MDAKQARMVFALWQNGEVKKMDNMKVNNKRLQKLILDTQKSVGQLSKLAYETGVQDGLIKANALNALKPLDNTKMRWIPCSEDMPKKPCECLATIEVQTWEITHRIVRKTKFASGRFKGADKVLAWMPLPEPYGGDKE